MGKQMIFKVYKDEVSFRLHHIGKVIMDADNPPFYRDSIIAGYLAGSLEGFVMVLWLSYHVLHW